MKLFTRQRIRRQALYSVTRAALDNAALATVGANDRQHFARIDAAPVLLNPQEIYTITQAIRSDPNADPATVNSILRRFGIIETAQTR